MVFSCDGDNPVSETTSNEVDVDWFLIKNPNMSFQPWEDIVEGTGYIFYYKFSSIDYPEFVEINDSIFISFIYNDVNFSYNISDLHPNLPCIIDSVDRIIYNQDMNYFTTFSYSFPTSDSNSFDSSEPNILIDYR